MRGRGCFIVMCQGVILLKWTSQGLDNFTMGIIGVGVSYSTSLEWVMPSMCSTPQQRKLDSLSELFHPRSPFCEHSSTRGSMRSLWGICALIHALLHVRRSHHHKKAGFQYALVHPVCSGLQKVHMVRGVVLFMNKCIFKEKISSTGDYSN